MRTRFILRAPALLGIAALLALPAAALAQLQPVDQDRGAAGLGLALRKLPTVGGVLYVTAHPDDENNGVLVKLGRGLGLRTGLLTVTRGDGGQNEIGPELFQAIGILRTEELAGVHRYDGAQQFFTRAYEFGFSFSVEETFDKWGREEILRDVVRVVRTFRPDVILTLPLEAPGGGQHHQATARLGLEAFRAAADPNRFPEQIAEGLRPWQARKVYEGGTGPGRLQAAAGEGVTVRYDHYDPLLGLSWQQFASLGRASHLCQGMSQLMADPGTGEAVYRLTDSEPKVSTPEQDILDGVDTTLGRLNAYAAGQEARAPFLKSGLDAIASAAAEAQAAFTATAPERTLPALRKGLGAVRELLGQVKASALSADARAELGFVLERKERDFEDALRLAHGLSFRVESDDDDVVPGQTFGVTATVFNQGQEPLVVDAVAVQVPEGWQVALKKGAVKPLAAGEGVTLEYDVTVGEKARYSQPYWKYNPKVDRYDIEVPADQTLPWSPPAVHAQLRWSSAGVAAGAERPAEWRYDAPVGGEKQKVVNVVPALSVRLSPEVSILPLKASEPEEFRVRVQNHTKSAQQATVRLEVPQGWSVEPEGVPVSLAWEGAAVTARFFVRPPAGVAATSVTVKAVASAAGRDYREGFQTIAYNHIQTRHLFHPAESQLEVLDVTVPQGTKVGYVMGVGDQIPDAIRQIGVPLTLLSEDDLAYGELSQYSTIVTGVRAYKVRDDLKAYQKRLFDWVEAGGHLVVMYNKFEFNFLSEPSTRGGFNFSRMRDAASPFAPYPGAVTSNRVTVEEAPVKLLAPEHPLLSSPNKIGQQDFAGWVQERGLYFFGAKDPHYTELLSSEDPWPKNEGVKKGMLTTAPLGKGSWTYVGIGLFRQLPAGTSGAYRILANLIGQPRGQ